MHASSAFESRFLAISLLAATLTGCDAGTSGALGQSSIGQGCPASTLPCGAAGKLAAPLAAGASVTLSVDLMLRGGGQPPLQLVSTDPSVFTVSQQSLTGQGPGLATLLLTSEDSVVLDFMAIWVQTPVALSLSRLSADGTDLGELPAQLGLVAGESASVAASLLSPSQPLTGSAPTTWSSADPSIASVVDEGVLGAASVVARAPGETTVTVSALGLTTSFAVEVAQ